MSLSKVKSTKDYLKRRSKSRITKFTFKTSESSKWSVQNDSNNVNSDGLSRLYRERQLIMDVLPHVRRYNRSGLASLVHNSPVYYADSERFFGVDKEKEVCKSVFAFKLFAQNFLSYADFFSKSHLLQTIFSGIPLYIKQFGSSPDIMLNLIWIQSLC